MTPPREPDRYDKQAAEIFAAGDWRFHDRVAAALRAASNAVLERAAAAFAEAPTAQHSGAAVASVLRYLTRESVPSPAVAPAAETCKAAMVEDGYPYRCTLPPRHAGPHKENDYAEWDNTADVAQVAPPSEPVAPEKEIANLLGRGHVRNPREGEPGDAETYSSPAPLLPRVLAALTGAAIDAASHGHVKTARDRNDLAAELRRYIADVEGKT